MKALVRQYPNTPTKESQDEVLIQSNWLDWMEEDGSPLTDENYGYALCENVPEECADTAIPSDFDIEEHVDTIPDEMGDGTVTVRSWTAVFVKSRWDARQTVEYL